jgi:hypothetical protein
MDQPSDTAFQQRPGLNLLQKAPTAMTVNSTASDEESAGLTHRKPQTILELLNTWKLELLACFLAIILLVAQFILLHYYDNQDVEIWNHSWKLNSIFALLTTITETCVAFAIGACMGQLRWLWFQNGQKELRMMDTLTEAKSASGAAKLLISPQMWR